MRTKLVVVGGETKATEINLKLPTIIGRGRNAQLTIQHPLVSRRHCEIDASDGKLWVRDLGSLNGTFVGNERVAESELPDGELLTIGSVTFRIVIEPDSDEVLPDENEDNEAQMVDQILPPVANMPDPENAGDEANPAQTHHGRVPTTPAESGTQRRESENEDEEGDDLGSFFESLGN